MKNLLLILAFSCSTVSLLAQGVNFREITLENALKQAGEQKKLVFIDCYTSWCGPCKRMANVEFPKEEAGTFFNSRFINVKFDMEKGEGKDIAQKYGVNIFPTFLILTPDGNELNRVISAAEMPVFIGRIEEAMAPRNALTVFTKEYADGNMSKARMKDFVFVLKNAYKDSLMAVVANDLLGQLTDEEKTSATYWSLFQDSKIVPFTSEHFLFLMDHLAVFKQNFGEEAATERFKNFPYLDKYLETSKLYKEGNRDKRLLLEYAQALSFNSKQARKIAGELFHALSDQEKSDTTYWPIFHLRTFTEWNTETFNYLLEHREDFYRTIGEKNVNLRNAYVHKIMMVIKGYDKNTTDADFEKMLLEVNKYEIPNVSPLVIMAQAYQQQDAKQLLDAFRNASFLFDDNLALNIAQPIINFLKENLEGEQRDELKRLVSDITARMNTDTMKTVIGRLV